MGCAARPGWQRGCPEAPRRAQRRPGAPGRSTAADDGAVTLRSHRGAWRGAAYPDSYPRGGLLQAIASRSIELSDARLWRPLWRLPDPFVWRREGARPPVPPPLPPTTTPTPSLHTTCHSGGRVGKCDDSADVRKEERGFLHRQTLKRRSVLNSCVLLQHNKSCTLTD